MVWQPGSHALFLAFGQSKVIREEIRDGTDLYPHLLGVKGPVQVKWPANAELGRRTGQRVQKGKWKADLRAAA